MPTRGGPGVSHKYPACPAQISGPETASPKAAETLVWKVSSPCPRIPDLRRYLAGSSACLAGLRPLHASFAKVAHRKETSCRAVLGFGPGEAGVRERVAIPRFVLNVHDGTRCLPSGQEHLTHLGLCFTGQIKRSPSSQVKMNLTIRNINLVSPLPPLPRISVSITILPSTTRPNTSRGQKKDQWPTSKQPNQTSDGIAREKKSKKGAPIRTAFSKEHTRKPSLSTLSFSSPAPFQPH